MLATQVMEWESGVVYPDGYRHDNSLDGLKERLARAEKFVLDPQACVMAAGVALSRPSSILAALEFAKLPFDPFWIEFANADVRSAMASLGSPLLPQPNTEVTIERAGFLIRTEGEELAIEYVHADRTPSGMKAVDQSPVRGRFSLKGLSESGRALLEIFAPAGGTAPKIAGGRVQDHIKLLHTSPKEAAADMELRGRFSTTRNPDVARVRRHIVGYHGEDGVRVMEERQGEEMYRLFSLQVLPALILLNCRNAVSPERVPAPDKLNRQRAKKGRPPIPEHVLVKIHLSPERRAERHAAGGSRAAARGGLVIGHFKVRKSGVWWWSPHWRGSIDGKAPDRTYVLTR